MTLIEQLRAKEPGSAAAYHLEGILEASDNIRSLMSKLGLVYDVDPESAAEALAYLEVEIFTHLAYHMKELRRPYLHLVSSAYGEAKKPPRRPASRKPKKREKEELPRTARPVRAQVKPKQRDEKKG